METAIMLLIIGVGVIIVAVYYIGTLVLNILNCYKERDKLREQLRAKKELYYRNGTRTKDAMEAAEYLNKEIRALKWALDCERNASNELVERYETALANKDKIIDNLNKQIERNTKKGSKNNDN